MTRAGSYDLAGTGLSEPGPMRRTSVHIAEELRVRAPELTVTRLASGLPVGSDLEYADEVTLGKAFAGRRAV